MALVNKRIYSWLPWLLSLVILGLFIVLWRIDLAHEAPSVESQSLTFRYIAAFIVTQAILWFLFYYSHQYLSLQIANAAEQLLQERALGEQSRRRLAVALVSNESGFWEWNIVTNRATFSKEWRDVCGLPPGDGSGEDVEAWFELIHPSDKHTHYVEMIRHIKGESLFFESEYRIRVADGSYKWISSRGKVVEWQDDGRAALVLGIFTDITRRKINDITLVRQQDALRALNEISSIKDFNAEDQLRHALAIGAEYLNLHTGTVSRIQGNQYQIRLQVATGGRAPVKANTIDALSSHLCEQTYRSENVFAIDEIRASHYGMHVSCQKNNIDSYIGIPIRIQDKVYGTLCFTSPTARAQAYDALDKDFMSLLSRWVSGTLERWQHQAEQQFILDRFAKLSESLPGFLFQFEMHPDGSSCFPYASVGIEDIYGVKAESVKADALQVFNYIHPEDLGWVSETISTSASQLTPWLATYRVMHPKHGEIWVRGESRPERLADGGTLWHGFLYNVTEEKYAELRLQETHSLREAIFDAASIAIISTDANGLIKTFNHGAEMMLGYTAHEVINVHTPGIFHLADEVVKRGEKLSREFGFEIAPGFDVFIAKAREGDEDENEWTYVRKNGSHLPVLLNVTALRSAEGDVNGYLGLARDISELKRIDQMKTEFISTVSHELRTPLTSISGALGIIMSGAAGVMPSTATKMLNIAHNNSLRLIHLVNDLLDMEKLVAGKMYFDMQSQLLLPIVQQAIEANNTYAEQFGVKYELKNHGCNELRVTVDSQRLLQVLANFLSNAAKFSPEKDAVDIVIERKFNFARVTVIDKGAGIPEEFRSRIFQKFSQADSSDSRQKGGTGLGLAISKEIVERLGGKIGFHSEVGKGSSFYFEMPCEEVHALQSQKIESHAPTGSRILIVEDDHEVADLLATILRYSNYRVDLAYSGKEALERIALYTYKAITIDLKLPDIHGIQLIRQLRTDASTQHIPVVVISANLDADRHGTKNDTLFSGIQWLEKPLEADDLIAAIKVALAQNAKVPS